jgi:hypothetical protein
MPNPRGHNPSTYIIICGRQTQVLATDDPKQKIVAASLCAGEVVSFLSQAAKVTMADVQEISDLQHTMMNGIVMYTQAQAEQRCVEMFDLLDELEDKFSGGY